METSTKRTKPKPITTLPIRSRRWKRSRKFTGSDSGRFARRQIVRPVYEERAPFVITSKTVAIRSGAKTTDQRDTGKKHIFNRPTFVYVRSATSWQTWKNSRFRNEEMGKIFSPVVYQCIYIYILFVYIHIWIYSGIALKYAYYYSVPPVKCIWHVFKRPPPRVVLLRSPRAIVVSSKTSYC